MKAATKILSATVLLSGVAVALVLPVYAQETPAAPPAAAAPAPAPAALVGPLAAYDANGDGSVTQEEVDTARAARLAEFDTDGTAGLSLAEYQALWLDAVRERMVDDFQRYDNDGDGIVTAEEFGRSAANLVARADHNGDGAIDAADRTARGGEGGHGDHGDRGPGFGGPGQPGPGNGGHGPAPGFAPGQGGDHGPGNQPRRS